MTATPPTQPDPLVEREKLIARSQPVRLVSIDDITIGQLVSFLFKLLVASLAIGLVVGIVVAIIYIVMQAGPK